MTKTLLLHIGTPKTGTTSVQKWLARTQRDGTLSPVSYPLWKKTHNQQRLVSLYLPFEDLPPPMRQIFAPSVKHYTRMRERYRDHLFGELRAAGAAVISGESLGGLLSPLNVAQLREDLEALGFRRFHVVLYVRDPADFFLSAIQQRLKQTTRLPLVNQPDSFKYDFLHMAEKWEHVFPGQLIVRKYPTAPCDDIIEDFAAVLQQCFGVAPRRVKMSANTTISAEGMKILQDYREIFSPGSESDLTQDAAQVVRFLSEPVPGLRQTKPALKAAIAHQIRANHKADGEALLARYGVDLCLQQYDPADAVPIAPFQCVSQILESVDQEIVSQLLLRLLRQELRRSRAKQVTLNIARRLYRMIPSRYRPAVLARLLRSRF